MFENLLKNVFFFKVKRKFYMLIQFHLPTNNYLTKKTQLEKLSICNTTYVFSNVRERT